MSHACCIPNVCFGQVIGVDIAPHMSPDDVPENLWLQVGFLFPFFSFNPQHRNHQPVKGNGAYSLCLSENLALRTNSLNMWLLGCTQGKSVAWTDGR